MLTLQVFVVFYMGKSVNKFSKKFKCYFYFWNIWRDHPFSTYAKFSYKTYKHRTYFFLSGVKKCFFFFENVASALTGWFPTHVFVNKCIQETVEKRIHFTFSFDSKETFGLEFLISFFSKIYTLLCEVWFWRANSNLNLFKF